MIITVKSNKFKISFMFINPIQYFFSFLFCHYRTSVHSLDLLGIFITLFVRSVHYL